MKTRKTSRLGALVLVLSGLIALSAGAPAAQAGPTPALDHSLTVQEYVDAGVPPIDKAWSPEDYQKAAAALATIAKADLTKLPRYGSLNSGLLFEHMVAQKNVEIFTDKAVPVDTRIQKAAAIGSYVAIFELYGTNIKPDSTFDSEALELGGFILRAELAAAQAVNDFKAAHGMKEDNAGFKQARTGFAQTAGGIIEMMMDHANIRISEATRFVGELKEFMPKLSAELLPEGLEKLKSQLKEQSEKESDKDLKAALDGLLAAL